MRKTCLALVLAGGAMVVTATPARADGFKSYQVCGGDQFKTCAAVEITVVGGNVTMKVWNLSGQFGSRAGTVFDAIGFYNLPAGVDLVGGSGSVTGPARPGDTPGNWNFQNGGRVNFGMDIKTDTPGPKSALTNGSRAGARRRLNCRKPARPVPEPMFAEHEQPGRLGDIHLPDLRWQLGSRDQPYRHPWLRRNHR